MSEYVYNQMAPARTYLDSMRSAIPKLMESNRSLIDAITQDKHTSKEIEEKYLGFESLIPELQEKLAEYGNIFIREYDFTVSKMVINIYVYIVMVSLFIQNAYYIFIFSFK